MYIDYWINDIDYWVGEKELECDSTIGYITNEIIIN